MSRIYTSKNKQRVLEKARRNFSLVDKISLWKDEAGKWHAAKGPNNVPNWAVEVEHVR